MPSLSASATGISLVVFLVLLTIQTAFSWTTSTASSSSSSRLCIMPTTKPTTVTATTRRRQPSSTTRARAASASASSTSFSSTTTTTTPTTCNAETQRMASVMDSSSLKFLPKLIVLDLDNTLWTPELYQIRQRQVPKVNQEISLFPDALVILKYIYQCRRRCRQDNAAQSSPTTAAAAAAVAKIQLAIASRTTKTVWARQLLNDFFIEPGVSLRSMFETTNTTSTSSLIQIQPGSKKLHFAQLRSATGFDYSEMLFMDDDERMNLKEISSQLGVLCVHTPNGITVDHFCKALIKYSELKEAAAAASQDDDDHDHVSSPHWMGYILNHENLGIVELAASRGPIVAVAVAVAAAAAVTAGQTLQGRVKFYSAAKKFGFVIDIASGREFFLHEYPKSLVA